MFHAMSSPATEYGGKGGKMTEEGCGWRETEGESKQRQWV